MNKFILGLITGVIIMLILNFLGLGNFLNPFKINNTPDIVAPEDLIPGSKEFGTLKVTIVTNKTQFVSGVEIDVGKYPGGKMAVGVTDNNGSVVFDRMPVGNFVIFFNETTYPKNFNPVSNLIAASIAEGQLTEKTIEITEKK